MPEKSKSKPDFEVKQSKRVTISFTGLSSGEYINLVTVFNKNIKIT